MGTARSLALVHLAAATFSTTSRNMESDEDNRMSDGDESTRPTLKEILEGAPVWNTAKDFSDDDADDTAEIERLKKEAEEVSEFK